MNVECRVPGETRSPLGSAVNEAVCRCSICLVVPISLRKSQARIVRSRDGLKSVWLSATKYKDRIEKQFEDCIAFRLRVLSSKLNVGHFPHLADLVTKINYNYHYMPDTGTLKTASGGETMSSRT
ncbi:hypothetical protein N665_0188s0009 [Sinapis alba]|nr:hypothetical protein N665_0188s0009 [Sinapis alba]